MSRFVDRLEQELLDVGYGRRARMRRRSRAAGPVLAVAVAVAGIVAIASADLEPDPEAPAAARSSACARAGDVRPTNAPVDAQLLEMLGTLREAPLMNHTAADADCAERTALSGGPAIRGSARWVAPGVGGGNVYLVAVEHWVWPASTDLNASTEARARFSAPAVCVVTVGGLEAEFDPTGKCFPVSQISDGTAIASSEITPPMAEALERVGHPEKLRTGSFVVAVVPDRVATVTMHYEDGRPITESAINNVVVAHTARDAAAAMPERVTWSDVAGQPVQPGTPADLGDGPAFDLAQAKATLATAPAPLAELYAQANTLIDGGVDSFNERLEALKGTPVIVHLWASWCNPCEGEIQVFQKATIKHGADIAFIGVNGKDDHASAARFLGARPLPFPSYTDPRGDIAQERQLERGYPMTQFIDRDGNTVHVRPGAYASQEQLTADIERYVR